jgi:hypothetical protein
MNKILVGVFWLVGAAAPAAAQEFPPRAQIIVEQLAAQHQDLAHGDDDQRRALTKLIIEQIVYELPAQGWGWKDAGGGRPPSKDAIAHQVGDRLYACDWQSGTTREPNRPITCEDISGQHFIPIAGVNHFAAAPIADRPIGPPPVLDLGAVDDALAALHAEFDRYRQDQHDQAERIFANLTAQLQALGAIAADTKQSLEAHRAEARKVKGFFETWIVERLGPVVGGFVTAWMAKH